MNPPASSTLAKYGLSLSEWTAMYDEYDGACHCCGAEGRRLVIDHDHVRGWRDMPPEERKVHVRGLACPSCNHFVLTRYADAEKHRQAAEYLDRHHVLRLGRGLDNPAEGPAVRKVRPAPRARVAHGGKPARPLVKKAHRGARPVHRQRDRGGQS